MDSSDQTKWTNTIFNKMHGQTGVKNRKCMMSGKCHFPGFTKVYISLDSIWMGLLLDMNIHLIHSETRFGLLFLQLNLSD